MQAQRMTFAVRELLAPDNLGLAMRRKRGLRIVSQFVAIFVAIACTSHIDDKDVHSRAIPRPPAMTKKSSSLTDWATVSLS